MCIRDRADIDLTEAVSLCQTRRVVADRADRVTLPRLEHAIVVRGHEKGIGVTDRIAGKTAHPEHLHLGFCMVPDAGNIGLPEACLLYTSPSPRDRTRSRMPSSA